MARKPAPVEGVYERGSGIWYARYRMNGKLVRKSFGSDRNAAVAYVEKARTLKRSGVESCQRRQGGPFRRSQRWL